MWTTNPEEKRLAERISQRIKKRRKEIVMTQQSLADRAGTTQGMMHCYESGSTNIPFVRLMLVARVLRVPISYFYEDADPVVEKDPAITDDEMQVLEGFRACSPKIKSKVIEELNKMGVNS